MGGICNIFDLKCRPLKTSDISVGDPDPHGSTLKSPPGSGSAWRDADPDPGGIKA